MKRTANLITVLVFIGIIGFLSFLFIIKEDQEFSEQENRDLQTFPTYNQEKTFKDALLDGSFSDEINTYFADQFPFRDFFVGIKGISELSMLKNENNEVLIGDDNYLAVRSFSVYDGKSNSRYPTDIFYERVLDSHFSAVKKLHKKLDENSIRFAIMIPPRTIDVAASKYNYPTENSEKLQNYIKEGLKDTNYIDIYTSLKARLEDGEYVYYKTDHHYTTLGAYYSYREVMKGFGIESSAIPLEEFDKELAGEGFYGTTWSKSGFKFVPPDDIYFYHYKKGDENDYTTVKDDVSFSGFYDRSYLDSKDKYSAFLGGNSFRTSIYKNNTEQERPKLLLVKDSFGLSLAPFLALHFDLEIINVNSMLSINNFAVENNCDYVLIVYNTENIITNKYLSFVAR